MKSLHENSAWQICMTNLQDKSAWKFCMKILHRYMTNLVDMKNSEKSRKIHIGTKLGEKVLMRHVFTARCDFCDLILENHNYKPLTGQIRFCPLFLEVERSEWGVMAYIYTFERKSDGKNIADTSITDSSIITINYCSEKRCIFQNICRCLEFSCTQSWS